MTEQMNIDLEKITKEIEEKIENEYGSQIPFNIFVTGKCGVGKSTLINAIFGDQIVDTGVGAPVTQGINKCVLADGKVNIYDTPGFELSGEHSIDKIFEKYKEIITKALENKQTEDVLKEVIHCVLYCINFNNPKLEPMEEKLLKDFTLYCADKGLEVPIVLVFTQSYFIEESKTIIEAFKKDYPEIMDSVKKVEFVLAESRGQYSCFGIDTLMEDIAQIVPASVSNTFVSVQKANIDMKRKAANATVKASGVGAMLIGSIPFSFVDAPLFIPGQMKMLAQITADYGLKFSKDVYKNFLSCTVGASSATTIGKAIIAEISKFSPITSILSGAMVSDITYALGETYIWLLDQYCSGKMQYKDLVTDAAKDLISEHFVNTCKVKIAKKA